MGSTLESADSLLYALVVNDLRPHLRLQLTALSHIVTRQLPPHHTIISKGKTRVVLG